MSLSLAYDVARSALSATGTATSVVSRNVQNVGDPNSARKSADLATTAMGSVYVAGISNSINQALFDSVLDNAAAFEEVRAVTAGLEQLDKVVGDPQLGLSPAATIAELQTALQTAAGSPHDELALQVAVERSRDVAVGLNDAAKLVADVRANADAGIADAVVQLRELLQRFEKVNGEIVNGTYAGRDVTDQVDSRNSLLRTISEIIGVRAVIRDGNDMVLFAGNGATLFETMPREIDFVPSQPLVPGVAGGQISIDGVPFGVEGASRLGGRVAGLLRLRDDIAVTFNRQLDEIARGLVWAFAEHDQGVPATLPDRAGLFTYPSGSVPAAGIVVDGLAAVIEVNANVDPRRGGIVSRLRDGGISDPLVPNYIYNATGASGFSDRLREVMTRLDGGIAFDVAAGISTQASVSKFAADSAGWLSELRRVFSEKHDDKQVVGQRALAAWQDGVGINLDDELTTLIALERSYQASSRLLTTVTSMFDALLSAAR